MVKTFFVKTFGCQMNVADSETMAGLLSSRGLRAVDDPRRADVIVVNTCSIRKKAAEKGYSELGRMLALRRRGRAPLVVAAGCVARLEGESLLGRLEGIDVLVGPRRINRLGELIEERQATGRTAVDISDRPAGETGGEPLRARTVTAFVNIMQGCDNRCSYCVVPDARGRETSREPLSILEEVSRLGDRGCMEVTLLGQNVNSYGKDLGGAPDFAGLLELLDGAGGVPRIRFTTSHPKDFTPRLARAMRDLPSVCEALHLPLQAGSDRVLQAMNRGYTAAEYRERVSLLRDLVPRVSLSTDIIVGYPGETEEDFEETLAMIRSMKYASLFAFKFSPREGTPAFLLEDSVPPAEKDRRLQEVLALQAGITLLEHRALVGAVVEVLVEGPSRLGRGSVSGRTRGNMIVNFPGGAELTGTRLLVRITQGKPHSLGGVLEGGAAHGRNDCKAPGHRLSYSSEEASRE